MVSPFFRIIDYIIELSLITFPKGELPLSVTLRFWSRFIVAATVYFCLIHRCAAYVTSLSSTARSGYKSRNYTCCFHPSTSLSSQSTCDSISNEFQWMSGNQTMSANWTAFWSDFARRTKPDRLWGEPQTHILPLFCKTQSVPVAPCATWV